MKKIPYISFVLGLSLLSFIFFVITITSISFLIGGFVSRWILFLSVIISLASLGYLLRKQSVRVIAAGIVVFVAVLGVSVLFGRATIDSTYDGNSYHKIAIGALKNGWNPVRETVDEFNSSDRNSQRVVDGRGVDREADALWVDTYPKATWIFAATIYKATGSVESGKALNVIVAFAVFLFATSFFFNRLGWKRGLIISVLVMLSPVAISQLYGYFNDGAMGGVIVILIICCSMLLDTKRREIDQRLLYVAIFISIVIVMNMKFTGLAYAGITMLCYWIYFAIKRDWSRVKSLAIVGAVSVLFGVLTVGVGSYVKNSLEHGSPLYPLVGKSAVDIMTHNQPESYGSKLGIHKFVEANLSPTSNIAFEASQTKGDTEPKIPFVITLDELKVLGNDPDLRQAGYGVWFGGILLLSAVTGIYLLYRYGKRYKNQLPVILIPLVSVAIIVLVFDNSWWARYLPQLYIFPIVITVCLMLIRMKYLASLFIFLMLFNVTLTATLSLDYQAKYAKAIGDNLSIHLDGICKGQEAVRVYGIGYLSGAMYNVWDKCKNIVPIDKNEFEMSDKEGATTLVTDIFLVRDKKE